jgi:hypothetical protein
VQTVERHDGETRVESHSVRAGSGVAVDFLSVEDDPESIIAGS